MPTHGRAHLGAGCDRTLARWAQVCAPSVAVATLLGHAGPLDMWVVKLGGSLTGDPLLPQWLALLAQLGGGRVTVVCGGGRFADEVRHAQAHVAVRRCGGAQHGGAGDGAERAPGAWLEPAVASGEQRGRDPARAARRPHRRLAADGVDAHADRRIGELGRHRRQHGACIWRVNSMPSAWSWSSPARSTARPHSPS